MDKWITCQKAIFRIPLYSLTLASQAPLPHVDNLSTPHFGSVQIVDKNMRYGDNSCTCSQTYPHIFSYVDKLSPTDGDNFLGLSTPPQKCG